MRIALASPYDFSYPGGVNEHIRYLAQHLRTRGHDVDILAPASEKAAPEDGLVKVDARVLPIPFAGSVARVALSPTVLGEVQRILHRRDYDIVHVHEPTTPAISPAVLHYSRAVNVGTFHQYRETHPLFEFGRPLIRYFIEKLDGRIAVSQAARDFANDYFPGEYKVIPNGIEVGKFQNPIVQPWPDLWDDGKLNVLFMGRLERRKGFRYLLRAFRLVKETMPEARLLVAGAYTREERLTYVRYVRHYRLRDVKFVGFVPDAEKPRWYRTAHLFCAPSTGFESFGIVLTEAMAAGTPVVASNIAGYREVVQDGVTGVLVPPEDEEALAHALAALLRDPAQRERLRRAASVAVQRYDWQRVTDAIEGYYEELLDRHRHAAPAAALAV